MPTPYEIAFDSALSDLDELLRKRRETDEQISQTRDVILALCRKTGDDHIRREKLMHYLGQLNVDTPKLTDAVKDALYSADPRRRLPATDVRDVMKVRGFEFANFANPLASVDSTLRRLAAQKVISARPERGTTVYWWNGPRYGARNSLANLLADRDQAEHMDGKIQERVDQALKKFGIHVRP